MSFGGAVSAMITSLKNNNRKRPSTFENMADYTKNPNTKLHFNKKATAKQLQQIKENLQKENRKKNIRTAIFLTILLLSLVLFLALN